MGRKLHEVINELKGWMWTEMSQIEVNYEVKIAIPSRVHLIKASKFETTI